MALSDADLGHLTKLKAALQDETRAVRFEQLVAALIDRLLGVGVAVAKGSFQHGGDAGTAGRQGRHLRIECKKYADTTALSDRELLGEVDQALDRDPALEVWILAATREVPEQLEQMLEQKAQRIGVPIVIVDWKGDGVTALAALCTFGADLVEVLFSAEAAGHAKACRPSQSTASNDFAATSRRGPRVLKAFAPCLMVSSRRFGRLRATQLRRSIRTLLAGRRPS
jgi:hypothetical protein